MRGTVNLISRTIALIVVFVIGFTTLAGFMVGGGYLAYTKVSIDVLQELGVPINTAGVFDEENAEVDITGLTIQGIVDEMLALVGMKDTASINSLTARYGFKLTNKLPEYITEKYREMPLKQLFSKETVKDFLDNTMIGDIYSYERTDNPDYNAELDNTNPYIWYDGDVEITGLPAVMASYTIGDLLAASKHPEVLTEDLTIADVLNLRKIHDFSIVIIDGGTEIPADESLLATPITVWLDESGTVANSMVSAIADCKILDVESRLDTLSVSDITSLVSYQETWHSWSYDATNNHVVLEKSTDVAAELAHLKLSELSGGELSDSFNDIKLSTVLGYKLGEDGKWYQDGAEVTGVMAAIAEYKVGELGSKVGTIKIGEVAGYEYDEEQDAWYHDVDGVKEPATGILAALANLTVDEVSDESKLSQNIQSVSVADIMGYKKDSDGNWCTESEDGTLVPVSGIMSVIADSAINEVSTDVDTAQMADILGFKPKLDADGDPIKDSNGNYIYVDENGAEVHVLMQKIARTQFKDIDTITDNLTVADLISEEDRSSGYIHLIPETTTLDDLPSAVDETFRNQSVYSFIKADVIEFASPEEKAQVQNAFDPDNTASPFAGMTIPELLVYITSIP